MSWQNFRKGMLSCPHCSYDGTRCPHEVSGHADEYHDGDCDCTPFLVKAVSPTYWKVTGVFGSAIEGGTICLDDESSSSDDDLDCRELVCQACNGAFEIPWQADVSFTESAASLELMHAYKRAQELDGQRVVFARSYELSRHCTVEIGTTGVLRYEVRPDQVLVELDEHVPWLDEWNNCIEFHLSGEDLTREFLRCVAKQS